MGWGWVYCAQPDYGEGPGWVGAVGWLLFSWKSKFEFGHVPNVLWKVHWFQNTSYSLSCINISSGGNFFWNFIEMRMCCSDAESNI